MSDTAWIIRTTPHTKAQPRLRLFCFPYAGGGASIYRTWASKLPADVEICAIQLPGRESRFREVPFTQLEPLVQKLAQTLQPMMSVPFAFFGYSLGALISFELARYLRRNEMGGPRHLFVAAHRAPQIPRRDEAIHTLPDVDFAPALHKLGGTPEAILQNEEIMQIMSPMLRADFQIYETYVYKKGEPLACPITAFGGEEDPTLNEPEIAAWHVQTSNTFRLHMLPGNHFFLHSNQDRLVQLVAQNLH